MSKQWEQDWQRREELYEKQLEAYIAMARAMECEVCSKQGRVAQLLGGRSSTLCTEHLNAWHEYLMQHELSREYNDAQADFYVAIYQCDEKTAREYNRRLQHISDRIYIRSGEWLKEEKMKWQER